MTTPQHEAERAEAANPATPPERLAELLEAPLHVEAVLANPALRLVLVEAPDFWETLSEDARGNVARSSRCPDVFVEWMLRRPRVRVWNDVFLLMASNRALPREVRRACYLGMDPKDVWSVRGVTAYLGDFLTESELALLRRFPQRLGQFERTDDVPELTERESAQLAGLGTIGRLLAGNRWGVRKP